MKKTGWWKIAVVAVLVIAVIGVMQLKASQRTENHVGQNTVAIASNEDGPLTPEPVEDTAATSSTDDSTVKSTAVDSNKTVEPLGPKASAEGGTRKETPNTDDAATAGTSVSPTPDPAPVKPAPVKKATFIELGADKCVPCKMMQPIMDELRREYPDTLNVVFYDVWKDPKPVQEYGINSIPTQVLLDGDGKEIFRHIGFWPKDEIVSKYKELGINL